MTTQEAVMTTQDIANRFYQLSQQGNWDQIQEELFSDDAQSIEPAHAAGQGLENVQGREGLKKKADAFNSMVEQMHGGYSGPPIVAGNYFAVAMGMDATMKGSGRMKMDEIAVYEVRDGKIVKEQFFF
jgi:ketosteroid isomerase-like protein